MTPQSDANHDGIEPCELIALLEEDLADSRALHDLALHMLVQHDPSALFKKIVEVARRLLRSDCASVQMLSTGADGRHRLDLIAHCGFTLAAAEHWKTVDVHSACSCGLALVAGERVVVSDVDACTALDGTEDLAVYRATGIKAVQTTPLRSRDGTLIGMLSTHWATVYEPSPRQMRLLDVLAREAASLIDRTMDEARIRDSEAKLRAMDRMKDQFLATLAHELRNPLAPIRNGLQILRLAQQEPRTARTFEMLDRQVDHMVRLVDDLLEVARINNGTMRLQRQRVSLSGVVEAAVEIGRPAVEMAGHHLSVDSGPASVQVDGDEVRLAQVFSNLINNAAKYTPPGGNIAVSVKVHNGRAAVQVADSGVGLGSDAHTVLFTLFGRLRPHSDGSGLGIGLALAKKIIELHGGSISASSEGENRGSTFTVTLPVLDVIEDPAAGVSEREAPAVIRRKVLVVDDNRDAADSLGELLTMLGCETAIFYDGHAALSALDRLRPEIAFIDIGMPSMDGYQLAQRIRSIRTPGQLKLFALTGWSLPEDRARSRAAGFEQHFAKPLSIERLRDALEKY